jgi:uncharacterized protein YeaO (DUF488 family)
MLQTKSILAPISHDDGLRISVMSRHTLSDGVTPDHRIHQGLFDQWWPELAPAASLVGDYYKRELDWSRFEAAYIEQLHQPDAVRRIGSLILLARVQVVTLLCIEDEPVQCHRRLLAEACARVAYPELELRVR